MASNRIIRPVIVICLLSATVLLGGCSPPIPKTWLPPPGGTTSHIPLSIERWQGIAATQLTIRR